MVQTNEIGRCAALLPCLAAVAAIERRPLAVLEVGASAGLNLLFDRYRYQYGDVAVGAPGSAVVLRPQVVSTPAPIPPMPEVTWRRGLDRRPVDITDDDDARWLHACVWPEQAWRRELLDRAISMARRDPPSLVRGDAVDALPALVAAVPDDAVLCVVHTAMVAYLPDRTAFDEVLAVVSQRRPLWRVAGEAAGLVPGLATPTVPDAPAGTISFLYGIVPFGTDDRSPQAVCWAGTHGSWLRLIDAPSD